MIRARERPRRRGGIAVCVEVLTPGGASDYLPFRDAVQYCPLSEARAPVRAFVFPGGRG